MMNHGSKRNKLAIFSSIFMSALLLFIIGLEPFVPQIAEMLPEHLKEIAMVVLPIIIMTARKMNNNKPITILPEK